MVLLLFFFVVSVLMLMIKIIYFCKYEAVVNAVQVKFPCIFIPLLSLNQTALQQKRILRIATNKIVALFS